MDLGLGRAQRRLRQEARRLGLRSASDGDRRGRRRCRRGRTSLVARAAAAAARGDRPSSTAAATAPRAEASDTPARSICEFLNVCPQVTPQRPRFFTGRPATQSACHGQNASIRRRRAAIRRQNLAVGRDGPQAVAEPELSRVLRVLQGACGRCKSNAAGRVASRRRAASARRECALAASVEQRARAPAAASLSTSWRCARAQSAS